MSLKVLTKIEIQGYVHVCVGGCVVGVGLKLLFLSHIKSHYDSSWTKGFNLLFFKQIYNCLINEPISEIHIYI